jgi:hypothetical protein
VSATTKQLSDSTTSTNLIAVGAAKVAQVQLTANETAAAVVALTARVDHNEEEAAAADAAFGELTEKVAAVADNIAAAATKADVENLNTSLAEIAGITSNLAPSVLYSSDGRFFGVVTGGVFLGTVRYHGTDTDDWKKVMGDADVTIIDGDIIIENCHDAGEDSCNDLSMFDGVLACTGKVRMYQNGNGLTKLDNAFPSLASCVYPRACTHTRTHARTYTHTHTHSLSRPTRCSTLSFLAYCMGSLHFLFFSNFLQYSIN